MSSGSGRPTSSRRGGLSQRGRGALTRRTAPLAPWALALLACAAAGPGEPEILEGSAVGEAPSERAVLETPHSVSIPYRPPPRGGTGYRLVLEYGGEREIARAESASIQRDSQLLELEYRELPVSDRPDLFQVLLEGLHYRLEQDDPPAQREIEVGGDRLRTLADQEVVLDLQGAQPSGDLTPRKVLDRVFGTARLDGWGNVVGVQSVGQHVARRFLAEFPLREAIAYARPALPPEPVAAGAEWHAVRYPASPGGRLGLRLPVRYTLGGVERLEGVPCAWILFSADQEGESVESAAGFHFDRVSARLRGEAWVELETSRIRVLRLEDDVRVSLQRHDKSQRVEFHRFRYLSRLLLELREGDAPPPEWADGSERFGKR